VSTSRSSQSVISAPFTCPLNMPGFYADLTSCTVFYRCFENTAYRFNCPGNTLFDADTKVCVSHLVLHIH
jgi:hypothetical protein